MSTQTNLGLRINEMILINIKIWHEATKVKDINGRLKSKTEISLDKRVECALNIRKLNAERSAVRWEVDSYFGAGTNETKVFSEEN